MSNEITRSSGNIFADLGLANPEHLMLKARVALLIKQVIDHKGISQVRAAGLMELAQSDVSNIVRGQLTGFSLERLFDGAKALGNKVEIKIKDETGHVLMVA